jgi:hypothetical protein
MADLNNNSRVTHPLATLMLELYILDVSIKQPNRIDHPAASKR